jgi:hypothetical protein
MAVIDVPPAPADEPRRTASLGHGGDGAFASAKPDWSTDIPSVESVVIDERRLLVYTGLSMNPTLREPDLLWIEPYGSTPVRAGDVVCIKSSEKNISIAHRVVSVGRSGIRTSGDNNPQPDARVIGVDDLLGRVVAARRGLRGRVVLGGWRGLVVFRGVRLGRVIRRGAGRLPHTLYRFASALGPFDRLLPTSLRPRLVRFGARYRVSLKLLMGTQTVGHYDCRLAHWHIQRPYRLFVDEHTLPDMQSKNLEPRSR